MFFALLQAYRIVSRVAMHASITASTHPAANMKVSAITSTTIPIASSANYAIRNPMENPLILKFNALRIFLAFMLLLSVVDKRLFASARSRLSS